jgi:hypothetical protein
METIQQEGLVLAYDNTTESWIFDVVNLKYEIIVSEPLLADLLTQKIERLLDDLTGTLGCITFGVSF